MTEPDLDLWVQAMAQILGVAQNENDKSSLDAVQYGITRAMAQNDKLRKALQEYHRGANSVHYLQWSREMHLAQDALDQEPIRANTVLIQKHDR